MNRVIFTFDTTHHALWAEEIAREGSIAHEIIPAPPEANAKCSIALETLPEEVIRLSAALNGAGVAFRIHQREAS